MEYTEKKRCGGCNARRTLEFFTGDNKTCNHCRDKKKAYRERMAQLKAEAKEQQKEEQEKQQRKETNQKYFQNKKDAIITCPICNYDIKKYKKSQHEKSIGHQHLSKMKEQGIEVDKPDRISHVNGITFFDCYACKGSVPQNTWGAHLLWKCHIEGKKKQQEKETQNKDKKDLLETQTLLSDGYLCCDE